MKLDKHISREEFNLLRTCSLEEFKERIKPGEQVFVSESELYIDMVEDDQWEYVDFFPKLEYVIEHVFPLSEKLPHDGMYPLEYLIAFGEEKIIEFLLEKGADPNLHSENHLLIECMYADSYHPDQESYMGEYYRREEVFRLLIMHGCSLYVSNGKLDLMGSIKNADVENLIPIIEECEPYFTDQQRREWNGMRLASLFKE